MSCWFCIHEHTNRCVHGAAFGTQQLDGGQAEYVRVPFADGTLQIIPGDADDKLLIMMSDIFPTGFYGASRAIERFPAWSGVVNGVNGNGVARRSCHRASFITQSVSDAVFVCLGCGPVGLCAILTARSKGVHTIFAVDSVEDRLKEAELMGGIPLKLGRDNIQKAILGATQGRGADAVIEVVGNKVALRSAFDLLRPCGVLSSIGFHQGELPFTALECYQKNLTYSLPRFPHAILGHRLSIRRCKS
jgi:threonine dehydrogenase-like Zn-dependent dehydrogenase